jgi:hypothetical protein
MACATRRMPGLQTDRIAVAQLAMQLTVARWQDINMKSCRFHWGHPSDSIHEQCSLSLRHAIVRPLGFAKHRERPGVGDRIRDLEAEMRILKSDTKLEALKETQAITEVDAGIDYQDATIRVAGVHNVDASWFML